MGVAVPHSGHHRQPEGRSPRERTPSNGDVSWEGWPPQRGCRALRLLATIGAAVGGVCLVLALLELVVQLGPRHHPTARPATGAKVLTFHGHPTEHPKKIRLPARYAIRWSFSCPRGNTGTFSLDVASPANPGKPEVTESGHQRTGTWRGHRGPGARSVYIVSSCDWRARLIPPADVSSPEPQPGRTHRGKAPHHGGHKKHHGHAKGHKKHAKKKPKKPKKAKRRSAGRSRARSARALLLLGPSCLRCANGD
jgi:hypothetical protein